MSNSIIKTITQHEIETLNRPAPIQARIIPTTNANAPAIGEPVASSIAGKVITAKVT